MNIFKELPIVFPFYHDERHLNSRIKNFDQNCIYKLISPKNALLPFQIRLEAGGAAPIAWQISTICGQSIIDITNNLSEVKTYEFDDFLQAVYFGTPLNFEHGSISQPLDLQPGFYFTKFIFPDGSYLISEVFFIPENRFNVGEKSTYFKIDFWNESDVLPIIYRDSWRQIVYLETYIHAALPEIDEAVKKDGFGSEIPTFQRMSLRYKFSEVVPDFLKVALVSLQMQDHVFIETGNERSGDIKRVLVSVDPDENTGLNIVDITFEDDILIKTACKNDKSLLHLSNW